MCTCVLCLLVGIQAFIGISDDDGDGDDDDNGVLVHTCLWINVCTPWSL